MCYVTPVPDFASRLRDLRTTRGLRQKDLARALGVAQTTIANYEQKLRFPDEPTLRSIADHFGTSLDYLLGRSDRDLALRSEATPEERPLTDLARELFDLLKAGQREAAFGIVNDAAAAGTGVESLYLEVIAPCMREVGRLWAIGEMEVGEEHFFSEAAQVLMAQLQPVVQAARRRSRNLRCTVFTAYGEAHLIGARMIGDLLWKDGWSVANLGGNLSIRHALRALGDRPPHLLALSVTMPSCVGAAEDLITAIRAQKPLRSIRVLVGGSAFQAFPRLWQEIGADGTSDGSSAVSDALRLLGSSLTRG